MKGRQRVLRCGYRVSRGEVEAFVRENHVVGQFLGKYEKESTRWSYAVELCRFFKWLLVVKGLDFSPVQFLNEHVRRHASLDVRERRWACSLAVEFSRDNPDLADASWARKRFLFMTLQQFFNYHEAPLSASRGVFGLKRRRKYRPKQMTVEDAKRILVVVNQRERAVLMCMLQSGMSIGDVLRKFNFMYDYVVGCIKGGAERIRVDFEERKGNDFKYFTFISRDAVQELRKWLGIRLEWLEGKADPGAIFISETGRALKPRQFQANYDYHLRRAGIKKGPFSYRSHQFRSLFKTEASVPERGIDRDCVEFWLGHVSGIESVGGVYNRVPEIYARAVEEEYAKLEPFINIYSSRRSNKEPIFSDEEIKALKTLAQQLKKEVHPKA